MQIVLVTYTWPGLSDAHMRRISAARETWHIHSTPSELIQAQYGQADFTVNAAIIGDRQPNVFLHHIIDQAFTETTDRLATVILANSDIRLQHRKWHYVQRRAISSTPSYDTAIHSRPPRPGDLDWLPRSFWIPRAWWTRTKQFVAPMFFPAAWWEDVLLKTIPNRDPEFGPVESSTAHEPHPLAIIPDHQRPISVKFNFAMDTGWRHHHYHEPREVRSLPHRHARNR